MKYDKEKFEKIEIEKVIFEEEIPKESTDSKNKICDYALLPINEYNSRILKEMINRFENERKKGPISNMDTPMMANPKEMGDTEIYLYDKEESKVEDENINITCHIDVEEEKNVLGNEEEKICFTWNIFDEEKEETYISETLRYEYLHENYNNI
jgi:uncharacterized small protein (DUF1192 family)